MVRKTKSLLTNLSTADLKKLLAARERVDVLEDERVRLTKELTRVDKELARLMRDGSSGPGRPAGVKNKTTKKTTRKKSAKKKTVKKKISKKTTRKKSTRKTAGKKPVRKPSGKKAAGGKLTLEEVVVAVIKKNGESMPFKLILETIVKGKLFKTKSKNFDNVLRRTLSTSKLVKRVDRGIYDNA